MPRAPGGRSPRVGGSGVLGRGRGPTARCRRWGGRDPGVRLRVRRGRWWRPRRRCRPQRGRCAPRVVVRRLRRRIRRRGLGPAFRPGSRLRWGAPLIDRRRRPRAHRRLDGCGSFRSCRSRAKDPGQGAEAIVHRRCCRGVGRDPVLGGRRSLCRPLWCDLGYRCLLSRRRRPVLCWDCLVGRDPVLHRRRDLLGRRSLGGRGECVRSRLERRRGRLERGPEGSNVGVDVSNEGASYAGGWYAGGS